MSEKITLRISGGLTVGTTISGDIDSTVAVLQFATGEVSEPFALPYTLGVIKAGGPAKVAQRAENAERLQANRAKSAERVEATRAKAAASLQKAKDSAADVRSRAAARRSPPAKPKP